MLICRREAAAAAASFWVILSLSCWLTEWLRPQVLATGLSGLYSSLPTKLDVPSEDWHCLHREDWLQMPSLVQFLNSLEFCNAVIQVGLHRMQRVQTGTPLDYSRSDIVHRLLTGCPP